MDTVELENTVGTILREVRMRGDDALREYTQRFDGASPETIRIPQEIINSTGETISPSLREAMQTAADNIRLFHGKQDPGVVSVETMPGVSCWRKNVPIEKVGLYIPGGSAPLFSTILMLAIPAKIAGCKEIILCTPPDKSGDIHPAILYACALTGIDKVFACGGAQAIAAMAYGTQTIPAVDKIFGPGNQYVTTAKMLVSRTVTGIDMPAGPSEVLVIADQSADPSFVAADLLSQAEHGPDSQVVLLATEKEWVDKVLAQINTQLESLPRKDIAVKALKNSKAIVVKDLNDAMAISNRYAPEHLILATDNALTLAESVVNAGSVFIGHYSPESAGDYASGTNHTLPTNGFARTYSGVSLDSFVKKITYQEITREGLANLGPTIEVMAEAESLDAHKNAVSIRLATLKNNNNV